MWEKISFLAIKVVTFDYFVVKRTINRFKGKPKQVLDFGCGNGYLAPLFKSKSYLGVELDDELVEIAKTNHPNYNFRVGDITKSDLKKKFDLILVIGVLHHLNDTGFTSALKVLKKHLSHSGKILVIEAIPPLLKINLLGKIIRSLDRGAHIRSVDKYKSKMERFFEVRKVEPLRGGIVDYAFFILGSKKN